MDTDSVLNETIFPGNTAAYDELVKTMKSGRVTGLVGAGISAPLIPAWQPLLRQLSDEALSAGLVDQSEFIAIQNQSENDPLEAASNLEDIFTRSRFRAKLSSIFSLDDQCTENHLVLMDLPFDSIVTTNYDGGLSTAFVRKFNRMPETIRMDDRFNVVKWCQDETFRSEKKPIVHLHGVASSPDHIIFTAEDYNVFYSKQVENITFVTELWKLKRLLVVGFSFKDPFLTRIAENALRQIPSDDRHFAFIGVKGGNTISSLERKTFSKKYRLKPIFYLIHDTINGLNENHNNLTALLKSLAAPETRPNIEISSPPLLPTNLSVLAPAEVPPTAAKKDFEKNLFVSWSKKQLFVEPRIYKSNIENMADDVYSEDDSITVSTIVSSKSSYVISVPHEYGATTLCKQLAYEFERAGIEAHYRDADILPNYKKKLESDNAFSDLPKDSERVVIIDNINLHLHERLLKEIIGMKKYTQLIVVVKTSNPGFVALDGFTSQNEFSMLRLGYLQRPDIRHLATQLYDTFDTNLISLAVEKVYGDLLDLCIPLTPSNVIMYLSIIHREGDFVALNRLQIMDKYIKEILRRPSDIYDESFNADKKIDIVCLFLFNLYKNGEVQFTELEWEKFCLDHKRTYLVSFDSRKILDDLLSSRILIKIGEYLVFKYRLFYSYFLGRYVANRPSELHTFLTENAHMKIEGLIEVISGFSADNTMLVTNLATKLETAVSKFYESYEIRELDPYIELEWIIKPEQEQETWTKISEKLTSGPANSNEIDQLKKSLIAEKKTEDQTVKIRQFSDIENSISYNHTALASAMRNSDDISGTLKIRAMNTLFDGYMISMQIALIFAPIISEQKYFFWNDMLYVNLISYSEEELSDPNRRIWRIVSDIPTSIRNKATEQIGTKKLGELYRFLAETGNLQGYKAYLNFCLILRSKPKNWEKIAEKIVISLGNTALYLNYMLRTLLKQFFEEINTNSELESLKRLIAIIQTKRKLNIVSPGSKAISKTIEALDKRDYFKKS